MSDIMRRSSHPSSQPFAVASIITHFRERMSKIMSLEFAGWLGQDTTAWTLNHFATWALRDGMPGRVQEPLYPDPHCTEGHRRQWCRVPSLQQVLTHHLSPVPKCGRCGMASHCWNNRSVQWCFHHPAGLALSLTTRDRVGRKSVNKATLNCSWAQFQWLRWNYPLHWSVKCSFTVTLLVNGDCSRLQLCFPVSLPTLGFTIQVMGSLLYQKVTRPVPVQGWKHA